MYYVLFNHLEVKKGKDFATFRSEQEVIEFLHRAYKKIEVYRIIETARSYHLGLVVTEELIKSVLEPEEETESLVPLEKKPEEVIKENKKKLEEIEAEEPSDMLEVPEDTEEKKEEELTPKQRTKKSLDDADDVIAREKKRQEQKEKGWELCTNCNSNRVAPWNKKKICSPCQRPKSTRKYSMVNR